MTRFVVFGTDAYGAPISEMVDNMITETVEVQPSGLLKIWTCGNELRFVMRVPRGKILQQAWSCAGTGEIEWRDVPMVENE